MKTRHKWENETCVWSAFDASIFQPSSSHILAKTRSHTQSNAPFTLSDLSSALQTYNIMLSMFMLNEKFEYNVFYSRLETYKTYNMYTTFIIFFFVLLLLLYYWSTSIRKLKNFIKYNTSETPSAYIEQQQQQKEGNSHQYAYECDWLKAEQFNLHTRIQENEKCFSWNEMLQKNNVLFLISENIM